MAAVTGLTSLCQSLLEDDHNVNEAGGRLGYPLQAAVYSGNIETVKLLLSYGAHVENIGGAFLTAIHAAVALKYDDILDVLVDHGGNVNMGEVDLDHFHSIRRGYHCSGSRIGRNEAEYSSQIASFPRFVQPKYNATALQLAAFLGQLSQVKMLLSKGAHIDARSVIDSRNRNTKVAKRFRMSPLELAVSAGHMEIVEYLIGQGASLKRNKWASSSCYELAYSNGDLKMARLLLDHGAELVEGHNGLPAGAAQSEAGYVIGSFGTTTSSGLSKSYVQRLLSKGGDVNANEGRALCSAAEAGNLPMVRSLLNAGARVDIDTKYWSCTPLSEAVQNGHEEVATLLLEAGADINGSVNENDRKWHHRKSLATHNRTQPFFRGKKKLPQKNADPANATSRDTS